MVSIVPAPSVRIEPPSSTSGDLDDRVAEPLARSAAPTRGIAIPRRELLAPRVEAEVDRHARAPSLVEHVDRPAVAQPRVVERQLEDLDARAAGRARLGGVRAGLAIIVTGSNAAIAFATVA